MQYFIGMKEYGPCPFGASTLVAFRKRFSEEDLAAILEASVSKAEAEEKDDPDDRNDPPNSGTLVLDATCRPADIAYPQDIDLLNQAQEKAEKTVDELCEMTGQKNPRVYCKRAWKDYLRLSKSKKCSAKTIRSAVRKQQQYIRRDIGYIAEMVQKGAKLSSKQAERLNIVTVVYEQQRIMFESGTHSIPRRIASLAQLWASRQKILFYPSSKETGVSGQLRPQRRGGYFRDGQDRLWLGTHLGTPARNCYLCHRCCPAALESLQVPEVTPCSILSPVFARFLPDLRSRAYLFCGVLWAASGRSSCGCALFQAKQRGLCAASIAFCKSSLLRLLMVYTMKAHFSPPKTLLTKTPRYGTIEKTAEGIYTLCQ